MKTQVDGPKFYIGPAKARSTTTTSSNAEQSTASAAGQLIEGSTKAPSPSPEAMNTLDGAFATALDQYKSDMTSERSSFRDFLRSSLASLDRDIIESVVQEFDEHCARQDSCHGALMVLAKDKTLTCIHPALSAFQNIYDAGINKCSIDCRHVLRGSAHVSETSRQNLRHDLRNLSLPPEKGGLKGSSEVDLTVVGAVNDLVAWGTDLRQKLLLAYRNAGSPNAESISTLNDLATKSNTARKGSHRKVVTSSSRSTQGRKRPTTAPSKRRNLPRHPPVGGGFLGTSNLDGMHAHLGSVSGKTRHLMRKAMGSYYAHDAALPVRSGALESRIRPASAHSSRGRRRGNRPMSGINKFDHGQGSRLPARTRPALQASSSSPGLSRVDNFRRRPRTASSDALSAKTRRNLLVGLGLVDQGGVIGGAELGESAAESPNTGKSPGPRGSMIRKRQKASPAKGKLRSGLRRKSARQKGSSKLHRSQRVTSPDLAVSGWSSTPAGHDESTSLVSLTDSGPLLGEEPSTGTYGDHVLALPSPAPEKQAHS